jgi:hypothetical protein
MRAHRLIGAAALAFVAASAAGADPVADLSDGVGALHRQDNAAAIHLLSAALDSRLLNEADREIALVRRGQAYLLVGRAADAAADEREALSIQPNDTEAAALLAAATGHIPPAHGPTINTDRSLNASVAARNAAVDSQVSAAQADYRAQLAAVEAQKAADAKEYAAQMSAYQAVVQAMQQQAAAAQAAWEVKACKAGDRSRCAHK